MSKPSSWFEGGRVRVRSRSQILWVVRVGLEQRTRLVDSFFVLVVFYRFDSESARNMKMEASPVAIATSLRLLTKIAKDPNVRTQCPCPHPRF